MPELWSLHGLQLSEDHGDMNEGRYERHVFVCLNERDPDHARACCAGSGSRDIHARLKKLAKERGLKPRIRVNKAGCLDTCELGPSIVVYPENVWYGRVTLDDVEEIVESHLVNGVPVERLRV